MELTIRELAQRLGATLVGDPKGRRVRAVNALEAAGPSDVTFVTGNRHTDAAVLSGAAALIVKTAIPGLDKPQLVVVSVDAALIEALRIFAPALTPPRPGIDSTALVAKGVVLGQGVSVGPFVVIEEDVEIGDQTVIAAGCRIGQRTRIGSGSRLDGNVVVYHDCRIGQQVIIQANTTIGSVGFGYVSAEGRPQLVPHNGGVVIEDYVEIGANCCIDRAKFANTIVGAGTKIDNLVQVAHNVVIGKCCLIASQVGIAGSCRIGDGVVMAGQVGLADNIQIGNGVMVGARSGVVNDVPAGQRLWGVPAIEIKKAMRVIGEVLRLPKTVKQVKELTKKVEKLEAAKDHQG